MSNLFSLLSAVLFLSISTIINGQDQVEALRLIEEDYKNLLITTADLNLELNRIADQSIKSELNQAKRDLIADFVSGPFKIFASSQTEIVINGQKSSIKKYLQNIRASSPDNIKIEVSGIDQSGAGLFVEFEQTGLKRGPTSLSARLIMIGDDLIIESIYDKTYKQRLIADNAPEENISSETSTVSNGIQKNVPTLDMGEVIFSNKSLLLQGRINNPKDIGKLQLNADQFYNQEVTVDQSGRFNVLIPTPVQPSVDLVFKYSYGNKFVLMRKNLVIASTILESDDLVSKELETDKISLVAGHE